MDNFDTRWRWCNQQYAFGSTSGEKQQLPFESSLPTIEQTKRRTIDIRVNEIVVSNIKTNVEPHLMDTKAIMEQNMACLYAPRYFVWCWLCQHNL